MNRRIVLIVLAALALIATGCRKKQQAGGGSATVSIAITGAPESAVLVGDKFALDVEITPEGAGAGPVVWSSSNPEVVKVDAEGRAVARGEGDCEITATAAGASGKLAVSVNHRDPAKDEMGHTGSAKVETERILFPIGNAGWMGELWYEGGNNSVTYYDNGTFKVDWNAPKDCFVEVGYHYGKAGVKYQDMRYHCYFKHSKTGFGGFSNYIGLHGWTVDPLAEFFIIEDWYTTPVLYFLGELKGESTVDGDKYTIYQNDKKTSPTEPGGINDFPQYFAVRENARESGHIDVCAHFKNWEKLGMRMGDIYNLRYLVDVTGGAGSLDCTYLFMSDGQY